MRTDYEALHAQREFKHRVPELLPANQCWGIDTTEVCDGHGVRHIVLGIVDHGSRMAIALRWIRRFNRWTLLGCLFLAIGEFGKPDSIKSDNHPVFRAHKIRILLNRIGVRWRYSKPGKPWQNGYIERLFGTFKQALFVYTLQDTAHVIHSLAEFRYWYNAARPHQHLHGLTPWQVWLRINPYCTRCRGAAMFTAWNGRLCGMVMRH